MFLDKLNEKTIWFFSFAWKRNEIRKWLISHLFCFIQNKYWNFVYAKRLQFCLISMSFTRLEFILVVLKTVNFVSEAKLFRWKP
jgi:hypothetical protein